MNNILSNALSGEVAIAPIVNPPAITLGLINIMITPANGIKTGVARTECQNGAVRFNKLAGSFILVWKNCFE